MGQEKCKCPTCGGAGVIDKIVIRPIGMTDTNRPLAKKLRKKGFTIRQIASMLGYKNPGSITNLLNK
jgi:hypothetical protein